MEAADRIKQALDTQGKTRDHCKVEIVDGVRKVAHVEVNSDDMLAACEATPVADRPRIVTDLLKGAKGARRDDLVTIQVSCAYALLDALKVQ